MRRFRARPTEVEAVRWTGDNFAEVAEFAPVSLEHGQVYLSCGVDGVQGHVVVPVGHWLVRRAGEDKDYWPVEATYFADKYEEVLP